MVRFAQRIAHPAESVVWATINRFSTTFFLMNNTNSHRRRTVHTDAITAVDRSIEEDQNNFICYCMQQLELRETTLWKILQKDLQLVQDLKHACHTIGEWDQNDQRSRFSHENFFHRWSSLSLKGYDNKPNRPLWCDDNPLAIVETPLHPQKLLLGMLFGQRQSWMCKFSKTMRFQKRCRW